MIDYKECILSRTRGVFLIRTKDFRRVILKINRALQEINLSTGTQYKALVFGSGLASFEGIEFDKEKFIQSVRENEQVIYIFRNTCPLDEDEIVQFVEKYVQGRNTMVKIFIIDPDYEVPSRVEPHVDEIVDLFPTREEVPDDLQFVEGLSLVEIKKASEENDPLKYREKILSRSGGVLEVFRPHEVDTPVGLEEVISLVEKVYLSGLGRGTLLLGVPGTGKTLICKFLARKYPVVRFNVGAVYSKYVGESEKRLRDAFERLKQFGSCFVLIDEFEKLLAHGSGDSGVSRRVLGEFLSWLQDKEVNNYVIATMNDITTLPLELIRPGRWDFTFGLTPPPEPVRKQIVEYYSKKYNVPVDEHLIKEKDITPADISAIYRLASIVGLKNARRFVKLTKDITPNFGKIVEMVKRYAVPVYEDFPVTRTGTEEVV